MTAPSIAFCISGQLRDDQFTFPALAELARTHDATVFISTWRRRGTKTSGVINRDQILRMFGPEVGNAVPNVMVGGSRFNEALPDFEASLLRRFAEVTPEQLHAHFPDAVVDIEDEVMSLDFPPPVPRDRNSLRMLYKIWRCNEIKRRAERLRGAPFDIVVRFRPDVVPDLAAATLAAAAAPVLLVPGGKPDAAYLDDVMAISASPVADSFAALFAKCATHPQRPWALIHHEIPRHLKEHGIAIGEARLNRWITEDFSISQPRNRAHLMEMLAADAIDAAIVPDPARRAAIGKLLVAANHLAEKRSRHDTETTLAAIDFAQEPADMVCRIAGVVATARQRNGDQAGWIAATLIEAIHLAVATGGKSLIGPVAEHQLRVMHREARALGVGELPSWRLVERIAATAVDAPLLVRLVGATMRTLDAARIARAEQQIAAALHRFEPTAILPQGDDWDIRTLAVSDAQQAVAAAAEAVRAAPQSPWAHCRFADLLLEHGAPGPAEASYAAALQCPGATADIAAMLSLARSRNSDPDGALAAARAARSAAPANVQFTMRLATLLDAAGQHAEAATEWRDAAVRLPRDPLPRRAQAMALIKAGRPADAIAAAEAAAALSPTDPALAAELQDLRAATATLPQSVLPLAPTADPQMPPDGAARAALQLVPAPAPAPDQAIDPAPARSPEVNTPAWQIIRGAAPQSPPEPAAPPPPPVRRGLLRRLFGSKV